METFPPEILLKNYNSIAVSILEELVEYMTKEPLVFHYIALHS